PDCFFEDRGVTSDAAHSIFFDKTFEPAAGDEIASDVIQPYRLANLLKLSEGFHRCLLHKNCHCCPAFLLRVSSCWARLVMFPTLNPSFSMTTSPGADAP